MMTRLAHVLKFAAAALLASLACTITLGAPPDGRGGGNGGGGSGGGGEEPSGPTFVIEVLDFDGAFIDFNDGGDVLGETSFYDGRFFVYTYFLGTLDSGSRTFDQIVLPAGWTRLELESMNNARQIVGTASYDPEGDGVDANQDGVLDEGNIQHAGICLSPDQDGDGVWEMEIIFPGPLRGWCSQINNDGDITGQDDDVEGLILVRPEGTTEPFPIGNWSFGRLLSDRDAEGDVIGINSGFYYTPRKYETKTGEITVLPTFDRATFVDAYAYSVNSYGEVVGRADTFPAIWSPTGEVSKIPGWPKSKNASGNALSINYLGEIVISSGYAGPHFYSPIEGLIPLAGAISNPQAVPDGYQLANLLSINANTQIAGNLFSDTGDPILCVLHPVASQ